MRDTFVAVFMLSAWWMRVQANSLLDCKATHHYETGQAGFARALLVPFALISLSVFLFLICSLAQFGFPKSRRARAQPRKTAASDARSSLQTVT